MRFFNGSVQDVKFLVKTGQRNWALDNLKFYVIIPNISVKMIFLEKSVQPTTMEQLKGLLLITLWNTYIVYYKGEVVDGQKELKTFPEKSAFISFKFQCLWPGPGQPLSDLLCTLIQ